MQVLMTRAMREKVMQGGPKAQHHAALVRVRMPEGLLLQVRPYDMHGAHWAVVAAISCHCLWPVVCAEHCCVSSLRGITYCCRSQTCVQSLGQALGRLCAGPR